MKKAELIEAIRECVQGNYFGVLATQTEEYPLASLVRYALDDFGQPLLLLSRIAEHSKNLQNNNKVSLFVMQQGNSNIQETARVSLLGSLNLLDKKSQGFDTYLENYFAYFPESEDYYKQLDFDLYQLSINNCRYIGGFAAAHTLAGEAYRQENVLGDAACRRIIAHMNADHSDAIEHYCKLNHFELSGHSPEMVAIDSHGFQLRIGSEIKRIRFDAPISDSGSARDALVALAQKKI